MRTKPSALRLLALVAPILLVACASAPKSTESQDGKAAETDAGVSVSADLNAPLQRRATDRWKLLVAKDGARAYAYLTPGYRARKTEKEYQDWVNSRPVKWISGAYQEHSCTTKESCNVSLLLTVETRLRGIPDAQQLFVTVDERWLLIDGVWYHLPEDV